MSLKHRLSWGGVLLALSVGAGLYAIRVIQLQTPEAQRPAELVHRLRELEARRLGPGNPPGPQNFSPFEAVGRPPLVNGFETVAAADVTGRIQDDELVLAVVIDGVARAYPLNVMTGPEREVFNDELAGHPIAATW